MSRRTKTPQEAVEAAQQQLERAKLRMAKDAASESPLIQGLQNGLDQINSTIAANSRKLTGFNSFENRMAVLSAKERWIDAEAAFVNASDDIARERKACLQSAINNVAEQIAQGIEPSETVESIMQSLPTVNIDDLAKAVADADQAWRAITPQALKAANETAKEQEASN